MEKDKTEQTAQETQKPDDMPSHWVLCKKINGRWVVDIGHSKNVEMFPVFELRKIFNSIQNQWNIWFRAYRLNQMMKNSSQK